MKLWNILDQLFFWVTGEQIALRDFFLTLVKILTFQMGEGFMDFSA